MVDTLGSFEDFKMFTTKWFKRFTSLGRTDHLYNTFRRRSFQTRGPGVQSLEVSGLPLRDSSMGRSAGVSSGRTEVLSLFAISRRTSSAVGGYDGRISSLFPLTQETPPTDFPSSTPENEGRTRPQKRGGIGSGRRRRPDGPASVLCRGGPGRGPWKGHSVEGWDPPRPLKDGDRNPFQTEVSGVDVPGRVGARDQRFRGRKSGPRLARSCQDL